MKVRESLVSVLLVALVGCASTAEKPTEKMFLNVAIIPVRPTEVPLPVKQAPSDTEGAAATEGDATTEAASAGQADEGFALHIDPAQLNAAIEERMKECFTSAFLLDPPTTSTVDEATYWPQRALQGHADVLLDCRLTYEALVDSSTNDKLYLNLPTFLFLGPVNYFISDRTYKIKAVLEATLYDLSLFRGMENKQDFPSIGSNIAKQPDAAWRKNVSCELSEMDLNFIDRAGTGEMGSFALSLICPSSWLAPESAKARACLSTES